MEGQFVDRWMDACMYACLEDGWKVGIDGGKWMVNGWMVMTGLLVKGLMVDE